MKKKFNRNFLEIAQSPEGIGLERALDLLLTEGGLLDMIVRARILLAEERRAATKVVAATEVDARRQARRPLTVAEATTRRCIALALAAK